ncbi:MAG: chemotaxis protein CheB [Thermoanaerobaculales bacterium]
MVRVLLADRSSAVRAVLRRFLEAASEISIVGEADDGPGIVKLAGGTAADAVVLDLDLPVLSGEALIDEISARRRLPIIVMTPGKGCGDQTRRAFRTLNRGVVGVFPKPNAPEEWQEIGRLLCEAIRNLGTDVRGGYRDVSKVGESPKKCVIDFLAIGASTGGPGALFDLLRGLGRAPPIGVAVVQHISEDFEVALAEWLAGELELDVGTAREGEVLVKGSVRIAPAGCHLLLEPGGILRLDLNTPAVKGHRPSVDILFGSLRAHPPSRVAAVLLSGMGDDGADGMDALHHEGVLTIVQDERSCAVFGMPGAALARGAAARVMSPPEIARLVTRDGERE